MNVIRRWFGIERGRPSLRTPDTRRDVSAPIIPNTTASLLAAIVSLSLSPSLLPPSLPPSSPLPPSLPPSPLSLVCVRVCVRNSSLHDTHNYVQAMRRDTKRKKNQADFLPRGHHHILWLRVKFICQGTAVLCLRR